MSRLLPVADQSSALRLIYLADGLALAFGFTQETENRMQFLITLVAALLYASAFMVPLAFCVFFIVLGSALIGFSP